MIYIDKYAYISKLNNQNPMYKLIFCMLTMSVCIWANSIVVSIIIIFIMGLYTVGKGSIPCHVFIKLMLVPISFLILGVAASGINVSAKQNVFIFYISVFGTNIGVTPSGIMEALHIFFRALGAVSCLYYLSLNTPMVDILHVLGKFKVPKLFIELMGLIYRFVFVLLETVDIMVTAQKSRMGYSGILSSYRSLAVLTSTLFIRAYKRADRLYTSLESRGYDGEINVIHESYKTGYFQYVVPACINLVLIIITAIIRRFNGGIL